MHFATKTVLALSLTAACTAAMAGAFPIKLPLGGSKDSAATTTAANDAAGDPAVAQDGMVRTFVASQLEVLAAQHELALAYDLKDQAAILASEQASLSSGGTLEAKQIQTSMDLSETASAAIAEKQAQQTTLTEEGKQHYVNSLPHFAKGVVGTRQLIGQVTHFTSSMKASATGGGLAGLGSGFTKLKAGMVIAKGTPSYSKNVFDMFRKTLSIGQSNGIKAPADATSALAGL